MNALVVLAHPYPCSFNTPSPNLSRTHLQRWSMAWYYITYTAKNLTPFELTEMGSLLTSRCSGTLKT
jgi:hypothetical protein